jgi:hypothetical protein
MLEGEDSREKKLVVPMPTLVKTTKPLVFAELIPLKGLFGPWYPVGAVEQ